MAHMAQIWVTNTDDSTKLTVRFQIEADSLEEARSAGTELWDHYEDLYGIFMIRAPLKAETINSFDPPGTFHQSYARFIINKERKHETVCLPAQETDASAD
jgi:hypothetical protein